MSQTFHVIGLMSGTSLDGVDLAYVKFCKEQSWSFELLASKCIPYDDDWRRILSNAHMQSPEQINQLDQKLGYYFAELINQFRVEFAIEHLDFISSHGHTILHQPEKGITLQIGNGQMISNLTKTKLIHDFRSQDLRFGGQGAPLVPIGDRLLFEAYDMCLNIGGIANVSFEHASKRIAFDICPVNMLLNHYASIEGLNYDHDAVISSKGKVNQLLFQSLNEIEYHARAFPKSLGKEYVEEHYLSLIDSFECSNLDVMRTIVEFAAYQIAANCSSWGSNKIDVLVTGGGAFHPLLLERMRHLGNADFIIPRRELIEFKEAIVFAFLGVLRSIDVNNCLASVTGASHDHCSGEIKLPEFIVEK